MLRSFILVFAIAVCCLGCPGSNGGSSNNVERDFYIEDYQIHAVWRPCIYGLDQPHKSVDETTLEEAVEEELTYILYPGGNYILVVDYFNDQDNTHWIEYEVYVDDEKYKSSGLVVSETKKAILQSLPEKNEGVGRTSIELFTRVPWDLQGKDIYVELWLKDENGVASEMFTFDLIVDRLWHILED